MLRYIGLVVAFFAVSTIVLWVLAALAVAINGLFPIAYAALVGLAFTAVALFIDLVSNVVKARSDDGSDQWGEHDTSSDDSKEQVNGLWHAWRNRDR